MRKNKLFIVATTGLVATTTVAGVGITAQAATALFSDVKEKSSHYPAIMDLAQRGIIQGYPDGTFKPNEVVTYAQVAKIIAGVVGVKGTSEELLQLIGITESPNQPVTRYSMATIITQALQLPASEDTVPFTDVASQYQAAVAALFANGITAGTSATTFSGDRYVTRGQLATFVIRAERVMQTAPTATGATLMVQDIQKDQLMTDEQQWSIGAKAKAILNAKNVAALAGARLDVIIEDGKIVEVLAIDLNTSGQPEAYAVLDGGGTSIGNIIVNADFIELKNMKIVADLRVAGKTSNIVLDKVNVQGQVFLQEAEVPKTASLTKVATNFYTDGVNIHLRSGQVSSIITQGRAQIHSNISIPHIQVFGPSLEVNAPNIELVDMHSWMYPEQLLGGTASIGILSAATPDVVKSVLDSIRKIQEENEEFIKKSTAVGIPNFTEQELQSQLESAIAAIVRDAEQRNHLTQEQIKVLLEQSAAKLPDFSKNISKELNEIYGPQLGRMLQQQLVQEQQQRQRLQELERQKRMQAQQQWMQQIQEQALKLQQLAQQSISQIRLQGQLNINNALLPSEANAGLALGEGVAIKNITTNLTKEQLLQRLTARSGQIGTLTLENGQQSPFNSLPPTSSNTGGSSGGGNTGGTTPTPPKLETANLEKMLQKAKERRADIDAAAATQPIAANGEAISYTQRWMPQSVVDALDAAIADAEKLLANAKGTVVANQRIASLTNVKLQVAVTQPEITQMVEKLEKLMSIQAIEGLKEKKWLYDAFNGKEINAERILPIDFPLPSLPPEFEGILPEAFRVMDVIGLLIQEKDIADNLSDAEMLAIAEVLLEELRTKDVVHLTDTQITFSLFEGLSYIDPTSQEFVELVPALQAEVAIKTAQVEITGAVFTSAGMILTYEGAIDPEVFAAREQLDLLFENGLKYQGANIVSVTDNEIHIEFEMHPDDRSPLQAITLSGYQFTGLPIEIALEEIPILVTEATYIQPELEPEALPSGITLTYASGIEPERLRDKEVTLNFVGQSVVGTISDVTDTKISISFVLQSDLPAPVSLRTVTLSGYRINLTSSPMEVQMPLMLN